MEKLETTLPAILIHSADAFIVHNLMFFTKKLNKDLAKHLGLGITLSPNHDCYGIDASNIGFARLILKAHFNKFNTSNYMEKIINGFTHLNTAEKRKLKKELVVDKTDSNYLGQSITNPWFVKF